MAYYSGPELMAGGLPKDLDLVFINAFSQAALLGYAFSAHGFAGSLGFAAAPVFSCHVLAVLRVCARRT